jgi:uncharacterized membrane protein
VPAWSHLHPAVIHFPVVLLLVVPAVLTLGLLWPAQRAGLHTCALGLLFLGTALACLAVVTGLALPVPATPSVELLETLRAHEHLAKGTLLTFAVLALAQALLQALTYLPRTRPSRGVVLILQVAWLLADAGATLPLLRTAHLGGRLVHELDIHGQTRR